MSEQNGRDLGNSPIVPFETYEEYEELSNEELSSRYANVVNEFVTKAMTYSRGVQTSTDYLLKEVKDLKSVGDYGYSKSQNKSKEIALARKLVEHDEICGTVLDRLISFCVTKGTIENVEDKELLVLLKSWSEGIGNLESSGSPKTHVYVNKAEGINVVFEQIIERLLVDGDAIISEAWASDVDLDEGEHVLPYKINIHDTLLAEIDEIYFKKTGQEKISLNLDLVTETFGKSNKDNKLKLYSESGDPFTTHLKLRPKTFSVWGTSYFRRAFHPVANKKKIEALETNTIEGLINRLTIIKAGKIDGETEGGIVAPHRLAVLERMISQPKVNNFILWPGDDISVEDVSPDSNILTYDNKYESANEQLLAALGFPRVLIDGSGTSTENWQKFLGVIADLDKIRNNYLIPWINNVFKQIAEKNGYKNEKPRFVFSRIRLHDLNDLLNAVKVFYDRGLMSELSAVTSGDLDYNIEYARRAVESTEGIIAEYGGPGFLPYAKNTEDGNNKEGNDSPEKTIDKEDKVSASILDSERKSIIEVFEDYLFVLHDMYSKKIVSAVKAKDYDRVDDIIFVYSTHMKRDIKEQMLTLFKDELQGYKIDDSLLVASQTWLIGFIDGFFEEIGKEVSLVIANNKEDRTPLLPNLVAGILTAMKTKRLRLYSSSVYAKARSAGELTVMKASGGDRIQWKSAETEATCEYCSAMHNKTLSLEAFFADFPPHPNCECWGKSTNEGISDDTPTKDTSNWGNITK